MIWSEGDIGLAVLNAMVWCGLWLMAGFGLRVFADKLIHYLERRHDEHVSRWGR